MRPLKILLSLLVPGTFSLLCTSNPQITGPSTELGNPVYIGVVLDTTLNPAQNANVTVFKMITVSNSNIAFDTIGIEIVSFITDTQGLFSIDNMVPGEYRIQSYTSDSSLFALKRVLIIDEQDSTMYDTLILGPSGSVKGVTTRRGQLASQSNAEINREPYLPFYLSGLCKIDFYPFSSLSADQETVVVTEVTDELAAGGGGRDRDEHRAVDCVGGVVERNHRVMERGLGVDNAEVAAGPQVHLHLTVRDRARAHPTGIAVHLSRGDR